MPCYDERNSGRETAVRMKRDGIDAKLVVDRKNASGTALILVDSKGQNVISVADAIAFAQKAAAISVTRPGAQTSVPWRREVRT